MAAFVAGFLAWRIQNDKRPANHAAPGQHDELRDPRATDNLIAQLESDLKPLLACACYGIVHHALLGWLPPSQHVPLLRRTFEIWSMERASETSRFAGWAFSRIPLVSRDVRPLGEPQLETDALLRVRQTTEPLGAILAAYYLGSPWSDAELVKRLDSVSDYEPNNAAALRAALQPTQ